MSKTLLPTLLLTAVLTVPATTASASDDDYFHYDDHSTGRYEHSDDKYRHYFDHDRDDDRIVNDSRRRPDDDFGNRHSNGRSGSRTIGQSVTDQLKPTGR